MITTHLVVFSFFDGASTVTVARAVHMDILDAVVTRIESIGLTGIDNANIIVGKVNPNRPKDFPGPLPGVLVVPIGAERLGEGTNRSDDIEYPVQVLIMDSDRGDGTGTEGTTGTQDQSLLFNRRLLWREQIRDQFMHQPEELVSEGGAPATVCEIEWVPGPIVDPRLWFEQNLWVSTMLLWVKSREVRP